MNAKSTLPLTRQRGEGRSRFWGKPLSILAPLGEGPTPASRTGGFQPAIPACRLAPAGPERGHGGSHPRRRPDPHRRGDARARFLPDAISSDVHTLSINGPALPARHDVEVSRPRNGLAAVIRAATEGPGAVLGRADLGCLSVGAVGDASVLELVEGEFEYRDVLGEVRPSRHQLAARGLVVGGRWWHPPR
jgi:dihydroorotase